MHIIKSVKLKACLYSIENKVSYVIDQVVWSCLLSLWFTKFVVV